MPKGDNVPFPKSIRLPAEAYAQSGRVFHVVIRARPGIVPFRDAALADEIWTVVCAQTGRGQVDILAACLMPDHLHLMLAVVDGNLVKWAESFKRFTTRQAWRHGVHGALWQPSFYDRELRDREFEQVLAYIRGNPVEAGMVEDPGEWPWLGVWTG